MLLELELTVDLAWTEINLCARVYDNEDTNQAVQQCGSLIFLNVFIY